MLELRGVVVSVLDRSGRGDVRLHQPNASVVDLQGYVDHTLPLSLLCITMILRVRRKFFEITTKSNIVVYGTKSHGLATEDLQRFKCWFIYNVNNIIF